MRSRKDQGTTMPLVKRRRGRRMSVANGAAFDCGRAMKSKPDAGPRLCSSLQLVNQLDVFLPRIVGAHAAQTRPRFVFRGVDEIEETGLRAADVAVGGLLVECVEFQQSVVVGAGRKTLDVFGGLPEIRIEFAGHDGAQAFGLAVFLGARGLALAARPVRSSCASASMRADSSWMSAWSGMFMRLAARAMRSSNACSNLSMAAVVRLRAASTHGVAWSRACFICSCV